MLKGIDVSEHQRTIEWDKVKDKVDFVILRAGYGVKPYYVYNNLYCNIGFIGLSCYNYKYKVRICLIKLS